MQRVLRKIWVALAPRSMLLTRVMSNGTVVAGRNVAGHGGRGIFIDGDEIEPELLHLEHFLDDGAVLIDVGANTGMYALKAAKRIGAKGVVLAVDPSLEMLNMLSYSVRVNRFGNVRLRNLCLGSKTEVGDLWLNEDKPVRFSLLRLEHDTTASSVLIVALDDLWQWEGLQRLDYIKVDVVGAEDEVLRGAMRTIERYRPIVQLAVTNREPSLTPAGYATYRFDGSANKVLVPQGDPRAARLTQLGWRETRQ